MDIGQKLLFAFIGKEPDEAIQRAIREKNISGVTLFRYNNIENPGQIRKLTAGLQSLAKEAEIPLLLIAADQEGGQLNGLGEEPTQFPGNMALGAAGDEELAFQVGKALGVELAAMGVNINYAPVVDLSTNAYNPAVGLRSFGEGPAPVARMTAAFVRGSQEVGVATSLKHFPGSGEAAADPHYETPVIDCDRERLDQVELVPFVAGIENDAKLVMTSHISLPEISGDDLPATLSKPVLDGLVRKELGFEGVIVSDAMEMGAIAQGPTQLVDIIAATQAGVDLLLLNAEEDVQERTYHGLKHAVSRKVIQEELLAQSLDRIAELKGWIAGFPQPELEMVGCQAHQDLAESVSQKALTLLRNQEGLIPIQLADEQKILVVVPEPADLTPADTSVLIKIDLAGEIRKYHKQVEQINVAHEPDEKEIAGVLDKLRGYDLVIAGSINAHMNEGQAALMQGLLRSGKPVIAAALRTPYDLMVYPDAGTYVCTYGILPLQIRALAAALFGEIGFSGKLPVSIPGLYQIGARLED